MRPETAMCRMGVRANLKGEMRCPHWEATRMKSATELPEYLNLLKIQTHFSRQSRAFICAKRRSEFAPFRDFPFTAVHSTMAGNPDLSRDNYLLIVAWLRQQRQQRRASPRQRSDIQQVRPLTWTNPFRARGAGIPVFSSLSESFPRPMRADRVAPENRAAAAPVADGGARAASRRRLLPRPLAIPEKP